jgi:hypothetical protein
MPRKEKDDEMHGHCCGRGYGKLVLGVLVLVIGLSWLGYDMGWWNFNLPWAPLAVTLVGLAMVCGWLKRHSYNA